MRSTRRDGAGTGPGQKLHVLASFPRPRPTTNPYIVQLAEALEREPTLVLSYFTWRQALTGHYDVLHLHWPETWLEGRTLPRRLARVLLAGLLCLRLSVRRTGVVRTRHNLEPPSGLWRVDYLVLAWLERLTRVVVRLNESTETSSDVDCVTIPHGHYRDWFASYPREDPEAGRVAFVGRIRRYKGVEHLLEVFRGLPAADLSLSVAGLPSSQELADHVTRLAVADPRITLELGYVEDATLVRVITQSSVVVLPYQHMHNSGTALAALSLDRPVLVPDNEVNRKLAGEVGPGWVHIYRDELGGQDLVDAVAGTRSTRGRPDLSRRDWTRAGAMHAAAYAAAIEVKPRRRRRRRADQG